METEQDYDTLLTLSTEIGVRLLTSGAEIYRVEESIQRLFSAYGADGSVFVIPSCIIASLATPEGHSATRIRRVWDHGTDIQRLEAYNNLCRALCEQRPPLSKAKAQLALVEARHKTYRYGIRILGYFGGTGAFSLFFGGTWRDGLCAGLCGAAIGLCLTLMTWLRANAFFQTIAGGFVSGLLAVLLTALGLGQNPDLIIIGALMALVPGMVFTNAMRDIMAGDLIAGITKTAEALLLGTAIALGTGFALALTRGLLGG